MRLLVLLIVTFLSIHASAYTFTSDITSGIFWSELPIKISRFVLNDSQKSELRELTDSAKSEWESEVGTPLWSFVGDVAVGTGGMPGNSIRWSDNFGQETGYDPSNTLAITVRYNDGTIFTKVEIILNGNHQDLRNNVGDMLRSTILHEMGHTFGLGHTSEFAIMAAYMNSLRSLQADDIDGGIAVVGEQKNRQSITGYSSLTGERNSSSDRSQVAACGTVDLSGGGGGRGGFVISLFLGIVLAFISRSGRIFPSPLLVKY